MRMTTLLLASAIRCTAVAGRARRPKLVHPTKTKLLACIALLTATIGCESHTVGGDEEQDVLAQEHALQGFSDRKKSIFVLLDGTANGPSSNTNIWRTYQFLERNNDPQMMAVYIVGVGTTETSPIRIDAALGHGMEQKS